MLLSDRSAELTADSDFGLAPISFVSLVTDAGGKEAEEALDLELIAEENDCDRPGVCLVELRSLRAKDLDRRVVLLVDELEVLFEWLVVSCSLLPLSLGCPICPLVIILCKN